MALDSVPYFVEGGAEHSAEVMRTLAYAIFGGQEGILERLDFAVRELDTPGTAVQVWPGVAPILNRAPGAFSQMYVGRMPTATQVNITPTDSSGGRSDLVIARVENPLDGSGLWSPPSEPTTGPYIFIRVIEGVPAGTKSLTQLSNIGPFSAVPLARIDIPASTGTITDDMITDLRTIVNPATGLGPAPNGPGAEKLWTEESHTTQSADTIDPGQHTYQNWPVVANWTVNIPEWATAVDIFAVVMNAKVINGDVWGDAMVSINGVLGGYATGFDLNLNTAHDPYRAPIFVSGTQPVPASARGTAANVKIMLKMTDDSAVTGSLVADPHTYTHIQCNWKQTPVYV